MDGELLMDEVDLGTPVLGDGRRLTIGNVHDIDIQGEVDYFRITSGTWAPIPEPSTCSLLVLGALALFPRLRRKRS